jgi:putative ABC transport system permease protein
MLKNYLKITVAVLLRRKFLTFVNLFGTVLTLTVLVVAFALLESIASPTGAQRRHEHVLAIQGVLVSGKNGAWGDGVGKVFHDRYVATLRTPDRVSYATTPSTGTSYLDGRKITRMVRRTDAAYWQILDFDLREGRLLSADDVDSGRFVAVINEATAAIYFPEGSPLGKSLAMGRESFEVVGVVANEPETNRLAFADVWVPLTATDSSAYEQQWLAGGQSLLYVDDPARRGAVRAEFGAALERFEYTPDPMEFTRAQARAATTFEDIAFRSLAEVGAVDQNSTPATFVPQFIAAAIVVAVLFMALPAINMTNLNIGRILERAPEIGLRKATGASLRVLVGQFVFESVLLAAIGGALAFVLSPFVLDLLNGVFTYGQLRLNGPVFTAGIVFVVVFGVLSGLYPAWKMARLEPSAALRGQRYV